MTTTKTAAEQYAEGLQTLIEPASRERFPILWDGDNRWGDKYEVFTADKPGRKFTRIVQTSGGQRHVHAFVENATGAVYKAEGWKRPAAGMRFESVEAALAKVAENPAFATNGSYLYR